MNTNNNLNIILASKALKDIANLRKEDAKLAAKIWDLLLDIHKTPFDGLGKPEPLKGNLSGFWSRRINDKHRLIYQVKDDSLEIASCYGHYDDK